MALEIQCPECKSTGRVSDILNGIGVHNCPNCGGKGKIIQADIVTYTPPQPTHPCPDCEAAAREHAELQALCDRQAALLTAVAVALRGPEPPQTVYGWADLPERAKGTVQERDDLRAGILRVIEDYPRDIKQDAEEALRALLAETEGEQPA